ncbi:MAG: triphosphoribosyl-dephospho-CoA synthase [Anaerovoracaceae bacterium]
MNKQAAQVIGEKAYMALRIEAWTTPKPGLVDRENSGAHRDMDYPLFLASCGALRDYFSVCARIGGESVQDEESGCFFRLRRAGLEGEKKMFTVTGGVNTHKGAVFSIGILSFCMGQLSAEKGGIPATKDRHVFLAELRRRCAKTSAALLTTDTALHTHGKQVYEETGTGGIRAEALSGFASAFLIGYPALRAARREGYPLNESMVKALLSLMCSVQDSNIVYRGGAEGLRFVRREAGYILKTADLRTEDGLTMVRNLDRECIRQNLSPGGCADLLAFSSMLYLLFDEEEIKREGM